MAQSQLGVIEDRGEGVVEFVCCRAEEFAQSGRLAGIEDLPAQCRDFGGMPQPGRLELAAQRHDLFPAIAGDRQRFPRRGQQGRWKAGLQRAGVSRADVMIDRLAHCHSPPGSSRPTHSNRHP